jgi:hypothetical protein
MAVTGARDRIATGRVKRLPIDGRIIPGGS